METDTPAAVNRIPTGRNRPAAAVLERVFAHTAPGIRYRLWDGTEGAVGRPDGSFTIVINDPETFVRAFSTTNTKILAEAFVDRRIDVEGDLFACLRLANQLEDAPLGLWDRLAIWRALRRVASDS